MLLSNKICYSLLKHVTNFIHLLLVTDSCIPTYSIKTVYFLFFFYSVTCAFLPSIFTFIFYKITFTLKHTGNDAACTYISCYLYPALSSISFKASKFKIVISKSLRMYVSKILTLTSGLFNCRQQVVRTDKSPSISIL